MANHCYWPYLITRNSSGWFCILSELRVDIGSNYSGLKESPLHQLVSRIIVPEAPSDTTTATFAPIVPDALNPGTASSEDTTTHHSKLIEDNLMGEVRLRICISIQRSTDYYYLMFRYPQRGIITSSLSKDKFVLATALCMEQLGIGVDIWSMGIIYPLSKRNNLLNCINKGWSVTSQHTQKETATLLGLLHTASVILSLGAYSSIRLQ